jgi:hypothetical protein
LAKFIANAFGLLYVEDLTFFADVPPSHPFYTSIQMVYWYELITGYACGSPGEPCDAQNRPYYRPAAHVTRGQAGKFVANGAVWTDVIPPTWQTFSDVPPTHPFWLYAERVARHGAMSGYTCGLPPAGPCDPQNRPYFLPAADLTRGQTAKIIATAAFPNCQTPAMPDEH